MGVFNKLNLLMFAANKSNEPTRRRVGLVGGVESYNFEDYLDIYRLSKGRKNEMKKFKNFHSFNICFLLSDPAELSNWIGSPYSSLLPASLGRSFLPSQLLPQRLSRFNHLASLALTASFKPSTCEAVLSRAGSL